MAAMRTLTRPVATGVVAFPAVPLTDPRRGSGSTLSKLVLTGWD